MTEAEWLAATNARAMLEFVDRNVSDRKLRLFSVACCRRIWHVLADNRSRYAVQVAQRYADGLASSAELEAARQDASTAYSDGADAFYGIRSDIVPPRNVAPHAAALHTADPSPLNARHVADSAAYSCFYPTSFPYSQDEAAVAIAPERAAQAVLLREILGNPFRPVIVEPSWLTSTVLALARGIYEEGAFDRMPILADALQDAGCDTEDILTHCCGPGPHVRGCWVVDAILGRR